MICQATVNEFQFFQHDLSQFKQQHASETTRFDADLERMAHQQANAEAARAIADDLLMDALRRRDVQLRASAEELMFDTRRCGEALRQSEFERRSDQEKTDVKVRQMEAERKADSERLGEMLQQLIRDQTTDAQRAHEVMRRLEVQFVTFALIAL